MVFQIMKGEKRVMKVTFIPDYRKDNSYQTNLSSALSKQGISISFGGRVIKSVLENRPDILHIHWTYPFMVAKSRLGTVAKSIKFICELSLMRLFGIKIIWTVHNIVDHEGKFKSTELFFNKLLTKLCDKLIVHCQSAKMEIMEVYNREDSSIEVIPHGSYIGLYENKIIRANARHKLNLNVRDRIFLYFGQVRPYKGIPELIDAFNRLKNERCKLLIVGKPLNSDIAENIKGKCMNNSNIKTVLTFVPDEDIQIYMNAADVVVLPFKDILTSGSVILSMSFGKPIVIPISGCISDTLDEKNNFMYQKTEEDGLFNTMLRVLNTDSTDLENMGKRNLQLAEQLSWDKIAKRTYDTYSQVKT